MIKKASLALAAAAALFVSVPASASDIVFPGGGTLAQIMDGSAVGARTVITLVNLDVVPAPYTLSFFNDGGSALTMSTTAGTGSALAGTIPVGGSVTIQTNGTNFVEGYAVVESFDAAGNPYYVAGSAVFGLTLPNGQFVEATCPLDTGLDNTFVFPFDTTIDPLTGRGQFGVALANSFGDGVYQTAASVSISLTALDQNGNTLVNDTISLPYGQHTLFLLGQRYPQIVGSRGVVAFSGSTSGGSWYAIKAVGVRATDTTYTSVTPLAPCYTDWVADYLGC